MEVLLQSLMNPGSMTSLQWLMVAIMLFVVIGSLYFIWKLYSIAMSSHKTPYKPNIGLKRMEKDGKQKDKKQD